MTIERIGSVAVARLAGRYDAYHEDALLSAERELKAATADQATPRLVLDFAKVEYFSSAMIEVLFRVWKGMQTKPNAKLAIADANEFCEDVLATAHLDSLWESHETVDDAVKALAT
jgi:anti-anti-sigma factor